MTYEFKLPIPQMAFVITIDNSNYITSQEAEL